MSEQQQDRLTSRTSRIGKLPVTIPKGVTVTIQGAKINVQGAKGKLELALPLNTSAELKDGRVVVSSTLPGRDAARMQGLARALIANMVKGTTEGFTRTLELVGTGYRAEMKGGAIHFALGFSHPVVFPVPAGISAVVPADSKGTQIVITGADRALVGQTAARVRAIRPPEPYGGKGVRYRGEQVREKAGKASAKGGKA
ncbi:MAG: 50S ribosomal protein L6 [Deltaproteobacteria bacterium]|nr:50S ribosomal protein L6 [Deltaproteobacteria bacterium]